MKKAMRKSENLLFVLQKRGLGGLKETFGLRE